MKSVNKGVHNLSALDLLALLTLFAITVGSFLLNGRLAFPTAVDADSLHIPVALAEIIQGSASIQDWIFPQAPGMFPEWLLVGVAISTVNQPGMQLGLIASLQLMACLLLGALTLQSLRVPLPYIRATAATCLIFLLVSISPLDFRFFVSSAFHLNLALGALMLLALCALTARSSGKLRLIVLACLLAVITNLIVASDALAVTQSVLPVLPAALLASVGHSSNNRQRLVNLAVVVVAIGLGALLALRVGPSVPTTVNASLDLSLETVAAAIPLVPSFLWQTLASAGLGGWILLFSLSMMMLQFVITAGRACYCASASLSLGVFCLASFVTTGLVSVIAGLNPEARYFAATFTTAVFWLATAVNFHPKVFSVVSLSLVLLVGTVHLVDRVSGKVYEHGGIALARCFDPLLDSSHQFGIASYWDARLFQFYSSQTRTMAPFIVPDYETTPRNVLQPFVWNTSRRYFVSKYDYAIVSPPGMLSGPHDLVRRDIERLHNVTASYSCGGRELLLLD